MQVALKQSNLKLKPLVVALSLALAENAQAADPEQVPQLAEVTVRVDKSMRPAVPDNLPATAEGVTAQQIAESVNAVTSSATIKYLPSIVVRERYIGDRNAIVSTRTTGTLSSAESMVYADDLLLSNLLGNSYAFPPRWGMVSPDEIERVDLIYGPFSALYPGNSMGGVVNVTTRTPEKLEAHVKLDAFQERFNLYGTRQVNNSTHGSASVGNKYGKWSLWADIDHLDAQGHPMSFGTASKGGSGGAAVTGAYNDSDQYGAPRIITGGYSIDHSVQDNGKIKLGYDFSPALTATYTLGLWQLNSDTAVDSYLKNAAGASVYNGSVNIGGTNYTVASLSPGHSEAVHLMQGLTLKSRTSGVWDWEVAASSYDYNKDVSRSAANSGTDSGTGAVRPAGQVTYMDGTGWQNLDLRGEWRPGGGLTSKHQVSFGYHLDHYNLNSATYKVGSDWLDGGAGALSSNSYGKTETQALYLQDAVRLAQAWKLVAGGRLERWQAFDGSNYKSSQNLTYDDRNETNFSPKLSLTYLASAEWLLRGSVGKAYRYPTVSEMFQSFAGPGGILINDPNLKPERVVSTELTAERALEEGVWRISLFQEDKWDALYSQINTTVSPNMTSIQNIGKIRTLGIETALQRNDLWLRGFDLSGSVTFANSRIRQDDQNPACVGMVQPRIPDWRATVAGTYHPTERLSYSLALRYSGRQYNALDNSDVNAGTYGGASSFLMADVKVLYKFAQQWSAAVGVDNVGNYKSYIFHPYPQRTLFTSLKWDY